MKELVIHFGMAKTGSTSIQATLARVGDFDGLHYLSVHDANAGRTLATAFMAAPETLQAHRKLGLTREDLLAQRSEILDALARQLDGDAWLFILSTEMLSLLDRSALEALRDWFAPRVDRIRLFGYVRDPASYIESMFQQVLKAGKSRFGQALRYPAYEDRFSTFEAVFGREHMQYRPFVPARFTDKCVVRDFLSQFGRRLDEAQVIRNNESLSRPAVGLLYIYRRFGPGHGQGPAAVRANRLLVQSLRGLEGAKFRLAPALLRPIIDEQAADLAWIAERLGEPLVPQFAPEGVETVASEDDLLQITPATADWLVEATGLRVDPHQPDLKAVADALHGLRPARRPGRAGSATRPAEVTGLAATDAPAPLDKEAAKAARKAARQAARQAAAPAAAVAPVAAEPAPPRAGRRGRVPAGAASLSVSELAAAVKRARPGLGLQTAPLERLLGGLLAELGQAIAGQPELQVDGLGRFECKPRRAQADAPPRILFTPASALDADTSS